MAHRVLGLDIGATEIKAVLAEVTWREITVLGFYHERVPTPEEVAHRLPPNAPAFPPNSPEQDNGEDRPSAAEEKEPSEPEVLPPWVFAVHDLIKKQGLDFHEVHTSLPGSSATTRILTLPFDNRRRIEQILSFELENLVPFDLDEMHLAFEVIGKAPEGGSRILVTMAPREQMAQFLKQLGQAGIDPQIVEFSPYTLFAAARLALSQEVGAYAVVDLGKTHTDFAAINGGGLVDLRSINLGGERLDRAIAQALKIDQVRAEKIKLEKGSLRNSDSVGEALRASLQPLLARLRQTLQGICSNQGLEITRIYLTGRAGLLDGLPELLAEELAVEVHPLRILEGEQPVSIDTASAEEQARYAYAASLVRHGMGVLRNQRLNLRHGEFFYRRQQKAMEASLRSIAIAGALILLLIIYNVVANHLQKKRYYDALSNQVVQLYLKAFPGAPPTQPLEQFNSQMEKTMAKYRTVGFFGDGDLRAIDILEKMSELIPPTLTVDIKKFDLTPDALKLEGECASFPDVDKIETALNQFTGFRHVKKESSTSVSEKVKFKFTISLGEKAAKEKQPRLPVPHGIPPKAKPTPPPKNTT